jgi:hypothetical protein
MGEDVGQFRRLARVRQHQQHIILGHHAKVAVAGLGRVDEMRGRAGLAKVAAILRATCPDLPMPETMTRPCAAGSA